MSKAFAYFLIGAGIILIIASMTGCGLLPPITSMRDDRIPQKSASWDQENLKRHDAGCPTAIFIAPGGVLKQCI
jgi:hypothetical protein